jgi:hypothetical protein
MRPDERRRAFLGDFSIAAADAVLSNWRFV